MKQEWSLDELIALFPSRRPDARQPDAGRPAHSATASSRFVDEESAPPGEAQVTLTIAPASEFAVRLAHTWPPDVLEEQRMTLARGLLLGIFKVAAPLALPSTIGSVAVTTSAVVCNLLTT